MTSKERLTVEQVDLKLDDLIVRFDRFISNIKWLVGTVFVPLLASLILALLTRK